MANLTLAALRVKYTTLDRLAPRTAARSAAMLWCRLPNNAGRRKDFRPRPGVVQRVPMGRRATLAAEVWGSGPLVYLIHGWGGWRGQLGGFVDPLVEAGFQVVGFDALSHGESDAGEFGARHTTGGEMIRSLQTITRHFGPGAGAVAHSMGCVVAARATELDHAIGQLSLVAPSPPLAALAQSAAAKLGLRPRQQQRMAARVQRMAKAYLDEFDLSLVGPRLGELPALIVHDTADKEAPYELTVKAAKAWPQAEFVTTSGLGHQRILADPGVITLATAHLMNAPPCKSAG